mgnify:CR=1 FL=1
MNPTDIYDALDTIAKKPFERAEFPFEFALATDAAQAAVAKLRNGATNKSDLPGGVLFNKRFHYAPAPLGEVEATFEILKVSCKNKSAKPAILFTTDGQTLSAIHPASGETLHCAFKELGDQYGFFLPAAGKERYKALEENPVDIKATSKLAKLYDALCRVNPDWGTDTRRHEMNQLMMRLIFCLFSEDVGIFSKNQFSRILFTYAGDKGEEAREVLIAAFRAMNVPQAQRGNLPAWTRELEYVNGGLFAGEIDAPKFDSTAFNYLREACQLDWREINPDMFGSMIQSVADPDIRAELGMHYTSVPNIMKVLGPLFLNELDKSIDSAQNAKELRVILEHMEKIRVFDPACGSGNFLVVAYRQLRDREMRVLKRLEAIEGHITLNMFSIIPIRNFYGIEIADFAVETAKLALFIAEYQANSLFAGIFGTTFAPLPLKEAAHITKENALRIEWDSVCLPPTKEETTYIIGNPPFAGSTYQTKKQKEDMALLMSGVFKSYKDLDYVSCWFFLSCKYIENYGAKAAFVSTNSICQGQSVSMLWEKILASNINIQFAYLPFKWSNNAGKEAAVLCSIISLEIKNNKKKILFDGKLKNFVENINAYLVPSPNVFVKSSSFSIFGLPKMYRGSAATDGGHLILSEEQKDEMLKHNPKAQDFIRKFVGSKEVVRGEMRYCLWIGDHQVSQASEILDIKKRLTLVAEFRAASKNSVTRPAAKTPHKFWFISGHATSHTILVPRVTSERRPYLPVVRVGADVISSDLNQVLYDAPDWCIALIASRIHLVWIGTVCGRLESRFRYSNTLGWNTFPVPKFAPEQLDALSKSARVILKTRYSHYPKTIAELYDPKKMPDDLRAVHKANDDLLESMYREQPFHNDTERLEHLFKLYAAKIKKNSKRTEKK